MCKLCVSVFLCIYLRNDLWCQRLTVPLFRVSPAWEGRCCVTMDISLERARVHIHAESVHLCEVAPITETKHSTPSNQPNTHISKHAVAKNKYGHLENDDVAGKLQNGGVKTILQAS